MGAISAPHAKRVSWSTLARRPRLSRVHTVNVNAADIPGFVQNFAGKSLKFIPVVKPQSFSSCRDQIQRLARALALDIHYAGCDMRANRHDRTFWGSFWCPELPPVNEEGIHTYVRLTCRELRQAWQRRHAEGRAARSQSLVFGQGSGQLAPLQSMGTTHRHRQRPWHSSGRVTVDRRSSSSLAEQDDPTAEASQKIIAGAQTLGIITERAIKSSVVEEKQRGFFTCQQQKHNHTPFRILAKIHKQPVSSRPIGNYRNFCLGTAGVFFFEFFRELQACHWFPRSHHWLG